MGCTQSISTQLLQINADNVIGASLVSRDDQKVLMVNSTGLIEYDVISNQSVIKRTDINAAWASRAVFSPNSEYAAVAKDSAELTYTTLFVESTNK